MDKQHNKIVHYFLPFKFPIYKQIGIRIHLKTYLPVSRCIMYNHLTFISSLSKYFKKFAKFFSNMSVQTCYTVSIPFTNILGNLYVLNPNKIICTIVDTIIWPTVCHFSVNSKDNKTKYSNYK